MTGPKVAVIDYESGNLRSVSRALERAGARAEVTGDPQMLLDADAAVLPGVGAGDAAMGALRRRGLIEPLVEFVVSGRPFLGVCLGMQLLMATTEEGDARCLGMVPGRTRKLPGGLKVPHMGWNTVDLARQHPVLEGIPNNSHFYFVHSYYAEPEEAELVMGTTEYGIPFCSAMGRDNLIATQFHPEKSSTLGLRLYENFVEFARVAKAGQRTHN